MQDAPDNAPDTISELPAGDAPEQSALGEPPPGEGRGHLPRLRRRVLLFFLAILTVVGVTVALINSRIGGDVLLSLLSGALEESGGVELSADIRVDLLGGALRAEKVFLDLGERGFITIGSLSISLQPFQLLRNRIIVTDITVEHPRIHLDFRKAPGRRGEPMDLAQFKDFPFDLVVHRVLVSGADLFLDLGGEGPTELRGIVVRSRYDEGGYRVALETGSGRVSLPGVEAPVNLITAEMELRDGALSLHDFNLFLQGVKVAAQGRSTDPETGENSLSVELVLPLSRISEMVPKFPAMSGQARLVAQLGGNLSDPRAEGVLELRDARIGRQILEDVEIAFRLTPAGIWLDGSVFHVGEGRVILDRANILFSPGLPVNAALTLDNPELAHILKNLAGLDSHTSQYQSGTVTVSGTLDPVLVDGFVDLMVRDHRTHTVGMSRRRGKATEIVHVPLGQVKSPIRVTDRYFQFHDGKVFVGGTIIDIIMTRLAFDTVFHFEYQSGQFDFDDARAVMGIPMRGKGSLGVVIHVEDKRTVIDGNLDIRDFEMAAFSLGNMKSQVVFRDPELSFREMVLRKGESTYHTRVSFDFHHDPMILSVDFSTDSMRLEDLFSIVGFRSQLGRLVQGRMVGNATLYGPLGNFSGGGRLVLPELNSPYQTLQSGLIEARIENNVLIFDRADLRGKTGRLRLTGSLAHWKDLDLHLAAEKWPIEEIDQAYDWFGGGITGRASLTGRIGGTLQDPLARLSLFWTDTQLLGRSYDPSELHLEWTDEHVDLKGHLFGKRGRFALIHQFPPAAKTHLDVTLDRFPYPLAVSRFLGVSLDGGQISGEAHAVIPHGNPKQAEGRARITFFSLRKSDLSFRSETETTLLLEKGTFRLDPTRLLGQGIAFDLRGEMDMAGNMGIALLGRLDWRLVALLAEDLQEAQGVLEADLHVGGRWGNPAVTGTASFEQARLKLAGIDTLLDNARGKILLDVNRVEIEDLTFGYGGGQMSISGFTGLTLPGFEMGDVRLQVELSRVGMELPHGFVPVLSGRVLVTGRPWPLRVDGRLRVDEGVYSRSIRWQKHLIVDRIMGLVRPTRTRDTDERPARFAFNVEIDAPETLEIKNNLARLELTADLVLTGTEEKPGLLNTLSADRGSIFFLQNEFEVSRFMIEFERPDAIYPRFDIYGETQVSYIEEEIRRDVRIYLSLTGTLDEMEVILSSDAGLNQTDIVTLLLTGQPASALEGPGGMATGLNALSALYGVDDQIRSRFKLDEFRLTSSYASSGTSGGPQLVPKLVIGKEIAEDIFITYTTTLGDTAERQDQRFDIRYRFDPFVLSVEWDNDSTLQHGNFGTDLMFHHDF